MSDLGYSSAELVYSTTLVLPDTMISKPTAPTVTISDRSSYVARLRYYVSKLPPMCPRNQVISANVPRDINKWTVIFVRNDAVRGLLVHTYKGPFNVLSRSPKHFKLDIVGRTEFLSRSS